MRRRTITLSLVLVLALLPALAGGCGGDHDAAAGHSDTAATTDGVGHSATTDGHGASSFEGGTVTPVRAAPALRLADIDGRAVDIRRFRGDPVLVTFVYATCPDVCPIIMESLRSARERAGAAGERTRVIAVSVDPEGDTPVVVRRFLATRRVAGFVTYLVGDRPTLEATWEDWQVATDVPTDNPELIEHSALIYGISASGRLMTAYPVGFDAAAVARDIPRLAAS